MVELIANRQKGEIRVSGERHVAADLERLCDYLDALVGEAVAEVLIGNIEYRLGQQDAEELRKANPAASPAEIIDILEEVDAVSGFGLANVLTTDGTTPIAIEVSNPYVSAVAGARKALAFSWWAGALSVLVGKKLEVKQVTIDARKSFVKSVIDETLPSKK